MRIALPITLSRLSPSPSVGPILSYSASKAVTRGGVSSPSTPGVLCSMGPALGGLPMKTISSAVMSAAVLSALACLTPASAMDEHKVLTPHDVKWGPAPALVPKGAQVAVMFGEPSKEGRFRRA